MRERQSESKYECVRSVVIPATKNIDTSKIKTVMSSAEPFFLPGTTPLSLLELPLMWCLNSDEARQWSDGRYFGERRFTLDESGRPSIVGLEYRISAPFSEMNWSRLNWFAGFLASHVEPFEECLLWVTQWGVWPSSENFHLFYRMRESYGERRPLADAPGHLFLKHEKAELTTFATLAILNGWDFYLLPMPIYAAVFLSHDEFVDLYAHDQDTADQVQKLFPRAKVKH